MTLEFKQIHNIIWLASFIGIIVSFICAWRRRQYIGYIVPPFTFFINAFLYNLSLFMYQYDIYTVSSKTLEIWSGIVRLHAIFLLIILTIFMPFRAGDP